MWHHRWRCWNRLWKRYSEWLSYRHPVVVLTCLGREAQSEGIEAWSAIHEELVMVIPWILGQQGDNPMQSEFAGHIGMSGNCFCRVCNVGKKDKMQKAAGKDGEMQWLWEYMEVCLAS